MVKNCTKAYKNPSGVYEEYFKLFPYDLSDFQKYSIEAIVKGNHSLVTSPTGSGKSLPAEFAIRYFTRQNKKVIYASPIKALSNQKYHDFSKQFTETTVGLMTGDIQVNPDASVLIVTAEILYNQLQNETPLENVACVVFDEIHYINDADRGHVWEESILLLPPNIQLVLLSATIASPERFALWIESVSKREVWISSSLTRVVPLTHYNFTTCPTIKKIKDVNVTKEIYNEIDRLIVIKNEKNEIMMEPLQKTQKVLKHLYNNHINVTKPFVLNQCCSFLHEKGMLPAIVFVFSRGKVEQYAKNIQVSFQTKTGVADECESILRRLPNYQEYIHLPDYLSLVSLLEKGIAIHHAGMLAILREIVEIMFTKGFVQVLFATETFAAGINLPVKTTVFTQLDKFTDGGKRVLYPHEYTQMSGRAGRRGIDTVGNVIHLPNLFSGCDANEIKHVMSGVPQSLISKFKVSYEWVLNNFQKTNIVKDTMYHREIEDEMDHLYIDAERLKATIDRISDEDMNRIERLESLKEEMKHASQKKRKALETELKNIPKHIGNLAEKVNELERMTDYIYMTERYLNDRIQLIIEFLTEKGFIISKNDEKELTAMGSIASKFKKVHPLFFARLLVDGYFDRLTVTEMVGVLSCFTKSKRDDGVCPPKYLSLTEGWTAILNEYQQFEELHSLCTGADYNITYVFIEAVMDWCDTNSEGECIGLMMMLNEMGVATGDFVKLILEINGTAEELLKISEYMGNVDLCDKLSKIPMKILKFIATTQSLYV